MGFGAGLAGSVMYVLPNAAMGFRGDLNSHPLCGKAIYDLHWDDSQSSWKFGSRRADWAVLEGRIRSAGDDPARCCCGRSDCLAGGDRPLDVLIARRTRRDAARHGEHLAVALRRGGLGRARRQASSGPKSEVHRRDRPAHPRGSRRSAADWVRALDGTADCGRAWRRSRTAGVTLPARPADRSRRPEVVVRERRRRVRRQGRPTWIASIWHRPRTAIVLCVDEKPSIQALERAQGYLRLPNGRALSGHSHDYKRHGTTTLFAALDLATGKVAATRRGGGGASSSSPSWTTSSLSIPTRKSTPSSTDLSTHKKNEDWLKAYPNVFFHFTPTRASWLDRVEIWFSILAGKSLHGASFTSSRQLQAAHRCVHQSIQSTCIPIRLDQARGPPASLQGTPYRSIVIPGTR